MPLPIAAGLMWGGRLALSAGARYLPGIAARVGTGLRGALGFAARRPVTTAVAAHLATDGASTDMIMPDMPNMSDMASGVGNWLTGSTLGNLTMAGGGLFLANKLLGGGGGLNSMLGNVAGIGAVGAAIAPLFMAENGMQRTMDSFSQIFRGIAERDSSKTMEGFNTLGSVYREGFGEIGDRLGLGGQQPAAETPNLGGDQPPPAAADPLLTEGQQAIAAAEVAAEPPPIAAEGPASISEIYGDAPPPP
ncbi:MAG: hypothetical protein AAF556_00320 [Pseudomonadota bacterium]